VQAPSSESSDESDSDSNPDLPEQLNRPKEPTNLESDDDADADGPTSTATALRTKNEVQDPDVAVPDITEVGIDEALEKIGTVMSVIENVVVVKGLGSGVENRAAERALDSGTLLVFGDRRVLGYVRTSHIVPLSIQSTLAKFCFLALRCLGCRNVRSHIPTSLPGPLPFCIPDRQRRCHGLSRRLSRPLTQ
jgi:hypothetical protein